MTDLLATNAVSKFSCLGDKCPDTCCKVWSMQVDAQTIARYKNEAPELLASVEPSGESPWIMKKDASGVCVKFEDGLCGIHKTRGAEFLGDACYSYPRVTRKLGETTVMTATMSCPEIVRLALEENACDMRPITAERLPQSLKDYLPPEMSASDALAVHAAFLMAAGDASVSAEHSLLRIGSVSRSLEHIDKKSWPQAVHFYLANADKRLPAALTHPADPFNLLHALCGLVVASKKKPSERLLQTMNAMEKALAVTLDWNNVQISTSLDSEIARQRLQTLWREKATHIYTPILRRWLQMQLSLSLYPFSGLGATLSERITIIGVRMATLKLALLSACVIDEVALPSETVVRIIQSMSRILDHLGDPGFSLQIYGETGWTKEARMRGLLEL